MSPAAPPPSAAMTLLIFAAASAGCGRERPSFEATERAVPAVVVKGRTLHRVATGTENTHLEVTSDGEPIVLSGNVVYDARGDGSLTPSAPLETFGPLFDTRDAIVRRAEAHHAAGPSDELYLTWVDDRVHRRLTRSPPTLASNVASARADRGIVRWRGGTLGVVPPALAWLKSPASGEAPPALAEGTDPHGIAVARDGTLVVLVAGAGAGDWSVRRAGPNDAALGPAAPIPVAPAADCALISSFDGHVYARCHVGEARSTVHQLDGATVAPLWPDLDPTQIPQSVDRQGHLYTFTLDHRIAVCSRDRGCEAIATAPDLNAPDGHASYRRAPVWRPMPEPSLEPAPPELDGFVVTEQDPGLPTPERLVARSRDDVWLLTRLGNRRLLAHTGRVDAPAWLPGRDDHAVALENRAPPTPWIGHCEAFFIALGPATEAEKWRARSRDEFRAHLPVPAGVSWDLVVGELHRRPVVGLVVHRLRAAAPIEDAEAATQRFLDWVAKSPTDAPSVTCTLPILDRALDHGPTPRLLPLPD